MHPRNIHKGPYDFEILIAANPELKNYVFVNKYGTKTINFAEAKAVLHLNKALLKQHYKIQNWDIPEAYLCPPIPGRADYIHHLQDLISGKSATGKIKGLDIGVGANAIYPILGCSIYQWDMVGTDISEKSVRAARANITANKVLSENIEIRLQKDPGGIFRGVLEENEYFHFSMCNPPFHASEKDAKKAATRKLANLGIDDGKGLNFGGQHNELWCNGGEALFIKRMIRESKEFKSQVGWFTCLVSRRENLPILYKQLEKLKTKFHTVEMNLGNKKSRFIAWKF